MTANEIERAYIYENEILDKNDPRRYFIDFIKNASKKDLKILDVGCACGILGAAIKSQNSNCKVYGIEYNSESISVAERKNCYENIIQADLNEFIKSPPPSANRAVL